MLANQILRVVNNLTDSYPLALLHLIHIFHASPVDLLAMNLTLNRDQRSQAEILIQMAENEQDQERLDRVTNTDNRWSKARYSWEQCKFGFKPRGEKSKSIWIPIRDTEDKQITINTRPRNSSSATAACNHSPPS